MPVTPQQLRELRFDERAHGYDKHQVDQVIARVADVVEELQRRLTADGDLDLRSSPPSTDDRSSAGGADDAPAGLATQVGELSARRDRLTGEVERLEAHLSTRRQQLEAVVAGLGGLLDDLQAAAPGGRRGTPVGDEADGPIGERPPVEALVEAMASRPAPGAASRPSSASRLSSAVGLLAGADAEDDDDAGGPPTQLHPVVTDLDEDEDEDDDVAETPEATPGERVGAGERRARPAWADAVPAEEAEPSAPSADPSGAGQEAEAMERFFTGSGEDRRTGWFRRRS